MRLLLEKWRGYRHAALRWRQWRESNISGVRTKSAVGFAAVAFVLLIVTITLRGPAIGDWAALNPDEAELMAEARLALHSPVPFSTWMTGTNGPYSVLFLAGLAALGAPLTPAFAHLLAAVLLAFIASVFFVGASREIGRRPALLFTVLWWLPIATVFAVGDAHDFGAMSTEYLPLLLIVLSALVPRERLVQHPWLFGVVGMLAGLAVGTKYQLAPVAVAFAVAQLIVLRPDRRRLAVLALWWLGGALLPVAAILLVMVCSSATDWALVDQMFAFLGGYAGSPPLQKIARTGAALLGPGGYQVVLLAGLIWLHRHSDRAANLARAVLVASGLVAMLIGGRGYGHYNIALFGAVALAATMPVRPGTTLLPERYRYVALSAVVVWAAALLGIGYALNDWWPTSPRAAAASLSADAVNRNPTLTRACPPGSPAVVWGWAAEIYLAQDWRSTIPYQNVEVGRPAADDAAAESLVRQGVERARCVVDATRMKAPRIIQVPEMVLPRFYPQLVPVLSGQFHQVSIVGGCEGCVLYVRNGSS